MTESMENEIENLPENEVENDVKTSPTKLCAGVTKDNNPCGMYPIQGSDYCYNHDPQITDEERREGQARGGAQTRFRASKKADVGNLVKQLERITGASIVPGKDGASDHKTLEDLRLAAMVEIERVKGLRSSGELGAAASSGALLQWYTFLRTLMLDMGLDLDSRLEEAENIIFNRQLKAERKGE